jgi:type I restriction enzyme S subunit
MLNKVCCIGATIGKTDRTWIESSFNQQINGVDWDKHIVKDDYGLVCMRFHAHEVAAKGSSTALPILKKSLFEKISIPVPPIGQQTSFAKQMESIRSIQFQQSVATAKIEATFEALLTRVFSCI